MHLDSEPIRGELPELCAWLDAHELVTDVLAGVKFKDGIKVTDDTTTTDERVAA